jgi:hypothetical protein
MVMVEYNLIMYKTQPQKLILLVFISFLVNLTPKPQPQPPPLKQTFMSQNSRPQSSLFLIL